MLKQTIQPILGQERLVHIDVIRGIAIFGILLVNMAHFSYPDLYLGQIASKNFFTSSWGPLDHGTRTFLDIFVQMKFIMMFSFLFGFGMVIMFERSLQKGEKFGFKYMCRLLALLLFGTIHAFFIWDGDILTDYALLGFLLFLFRKRKAKTLFIWAIVLYCLFSLPLLLSSFSPPQEGLQEWQSQYNAEMTDEAKQALDIYAHGTFKEIATQRIHDRFMYMSMNGMLSLNPILYIFSNLPYFSLFLLGAAFAKAKILHHPQQHRKTLSILWSIGLVIGLPCNILFHVWDQEGLLLIGAPLLMLFYLISLVRMTQSKKTERFFLPFAAVGRTAFSNYIFQSIIGTTIFYHYGLGLYGKVYPFAGLFISIAIFILQLFLSQLWLKKFRFGPLEWIWRNITYWQIFSIKKTN
ncbi:DUF418 domain-containing protein [Lederbergia sp. NSJ-179]|nr:DUF418 domain-containing protein [Lederbergia sp. NSJ-179]MCJ7839724.1 DUF418 domain-containing protein [Lederbergia sp. NSJ-179]